MPEGSELPLRLITQYDLTYS